MKTPQVTAYFKNLFDRYKYILLVCVAGVLLMIWPQNHEAADQQPICEHQSITAGLEARIQAVLEEMDGVGKSRVLLTMENGEKTEYAYDRTDSENRTDNGGSASRQTELVTVSQSGGQSPVPLRTTAPEYRGAVVVCEGGGSAAVRLAVTKVIQSLTGLSADRIVISKMK